MDIKLLFTVKESCDALGQSRSRLYEHFQAGTIKTVKVGKRTYVKATELQRYVDSLPQVTMDVVSE
ncbi:MAG: helix-turn-helix domain-containing protein [Propionibacteriaceae bacterium]|nr:helix-turn-helix domain-containing protein [Propionibacteriaceae bacterium]